MDPRKLRHLHLTGLKRVYFPGPQRGDKSHRLALAIRRPFRAEWSVIPDPMSRQSYSNNALRNARSPCNCHFRHCRVSPMISIQAGNMACIVDAGMFKREQISGKSAATKCKSGEGTCPHHKWSRWTEWRKRAFRWEEACRAHDRSRSASPRHARELPRES